MANLGWVQKIAARSKCDVVLIGVRGMYASGGNKRGIYDDALFWVQKSTGFIASYNGNTDPSGYRKGKGTGSGKGMACLKPGVWLYKPGIHYGSKPHPAFRQHGKVTVTRDGSPNYDDTGMFGINIHKGGVNTTSSLGCQTIPPKQWDDFKATGDRLLKAAKQPTFEYVLIESKEIK